MAVITDLSSQKRNTDRVNVFLDGRFAFGLPVEAAAGLRIGQQLAEDEIENLKRLDETDKAKNIALRILSLRKISQVVLSALHFANKSIIVRVHGLAEESLKCQQCYAVLLHKTSPNLTGAPVSSAQEVSFT